jgi:ABC-2 type transport system permease protein
VKYFAIAAVAARQALAARAAVLARLGLYLVLMVVFSRLWEAVGAGTAAVGLSAAQILWYFGITELVVIGTPFLYLPIEEDVRRGDIACRIARPVSYVGSRIAEGAGEMAVRFLWLAVLGLLCVRLLAGRFPEDPRGLLLALPIAFVAAFVLVVVQACVGLSAIWLQEAAPVHWIVQKLTFVFGGLLFPLEIYPDWLRSIAEATPFGALVHGCASLVFRFDPLAAARTALVVGAWGAAVLALAFWLQRRGLRMLDVNGG